jgi:hypothetical protein
MRIRLYTTDIKGLKITNQTDEEMLGNREDDGRIVFETEQANKSLS